MTVFGMAVLVAFNSTHKKCASSTVLIVGLTTYLILSWFGGNPMSCIESRSTTHLKISSVAVAVSANIRTSFDNKLRSVPISANAMRKSSPLKSQC